jgi:hypothetical protein
MPFYVSEFMGGLGNQIFSVATAYALSKKYNTTFFVNKKQDHVQLNNYKCPLYMNSLLNLFFDNKYYKDENKENFTEVFTINCIQFQDIIIPKEIDPQSMCIILKGLPMKLSLFEDCLDDLEELFYRKKKLLNSKLESNIHSDKIKIGIMFRTFAQENAPQYRVYDNYYEFAINFILEKYNKLNNLEFHIYSDEAGVYKKNIEPILTKKNIDVAYFEHVGKRDEITDIKHLFDMLDLDDYILCNSTFHYWAALLSRYNTDKVVIYPIYQQDGNCGWLKHICPSSWINF